MCKVFSYLLKLLKHFTLLFKFFSVDLFHVPVLNVTATSLTFISSYLPLSDFRHGDMLFLFTETTHTGDRPGSSDNGASDMMPFSNSILEDEVDQLLYKEDGRIPRKIDELL